jgi:hypothetical protein
MPLAREIVSFGQQGRHALEALVANTTALEEHGGGLDPSFEYLRRFLAGDAEEALKRYQERQYFGAQFMLVKLMENCATLTTLSRFAAFKRTPTTA